MTSGGVSTPFEYVGDSGLGTYVQCGGTNSTFSLYLGPNVGGSGSYNLSGNGMVTAQYQYIGFTGPGTFTQSGGTDSGASELNVGINGSGTYNLSGSGMALCKIRVHWRK